MLRSLENFPDLSAFNIDILAHFFLSLYASSTCIIRIVYIILALDVGFKISADQVPIIVVSESGNQLEKDVTLSEFALTDGLDDFLEALGQVFLGGSDRHLMLEFIHLLYSCSEDEDILFFDLLIDFDIGPIHCADNQTAIQHELHVARSRSLSAG